ncbi:hypothetical protein RRSWK_01107 [Rhodopirellula sp. SWK7]|nr:hypothetical protein RRSWK_01107 [Rhodopirellula sp. SWK7]
MVFSGNPGAVFGTALIASLTGSQHQSERISWVGVIACVRLEITDL